MKIRVLSRNQITRQYDKNPIFIEKTWIISIFNKGSFSPLPDRYNILKLEFDDVTERDTEEGLLHFNPGLAKEILEFIRKIKTDSKKLFIVHCDAGISRSGAVGYMLNEWFNKYLTSNREDDKYFKDNNVQIMPNPEVVRILKQEMFGNNYSGIFVNDYTYDEDGNRFDNVFEV